jgi:isopenicillin N synthase-like dioxygenase
VLRADGSWSPVVIPEDAFCINLGDLMQRWTNDQWKSTVHRVVNPPVCAGVPTRRQSMAYFCNLDREATVEAIPSCVSAAAPAKYGPINGACFFARARACVEERPQCPAPHASLATPTPPTSFSPFPSQPLCT